jgi:psp operon transcriptional activator
MTANASTQSPASASALNVEALGQSEAFLSFQEHLSRIAPVNRPVLIIGERGTGKELAATRIHFLSQRWQKPFVTLNCAALSPTLIAAELFGHAKGAFTGAQTQRAGRFETADSGTLFLDEIGMIPMEAQEKILRVVEYGVFERVGSSRAVDVDVRIIAATNADLPAMAAEGRFKGDLLDRLSFDVLFLPPLRKRTGDVMLLADHFARHMAFELGRSKAPRFSKAAAKALKGYPWQGNIRELKNVVERAVYRTDRALINEIEFDPFQSPYAPYMPQPTTLAVNTEKKPVIDSRESSLKIAVGQLEVTMIREALTMAKFNQKKAAAILGLTYDQFRGLRRKHADTIDKTT